MTDCLRQGRLRTASCTGKGKQGRRRELASHRPADDRSPRRRDQPAALPAKSFIEGMLADPRCGMAARASLHLGQTVRFVDFRDGQMRSGKIIAMKDTQATVLEEGTKRT
jgi:hypothetical protein